jgi:hypothetical protein
MNTTRTVFAGLTMLICGFGCGLKGDWVLENVRPESAKQHFNISRISFEDDSTFAVVALGEDGQKAESKGTYKYNDWTQTLTLRMGAKELEYKALIWWMKELRMERELSDGNKMEARFLRAPDKPASGSICPTCGQKIP